MKQASPILGSGGQWYQWCSLSSDLKKEWHEETTTPSSPLWTPTVCSRILAATCLEALSD